MARGVPSYDGDGNACVGAGGGGGGGGGSGRGGQYLPLQRSSSFSRADSFLNSSLNRPSIGDVFFGTDDISDTKELIYKEDVFEIYRRELAMKSLRQQSKKNGSFGCIDFLKILLRCCRFI